MYSTLSTITVNEFKFYACFCQTYYHVYRSVLSTSTFGSGRWWWNVVSCAIPGVVFAQHFYCSPFLVLSHGTNKNSEKKTMKYKIGKISIVRTSKIKCNFWESKKLGKCFCEKIQRLDLLCCGKKCLSVHTYFAKSQCVCTIHRPENT